MNAPAVLIPSDHDVIVVESRLATLYSELSPEQQTLLDTIIATGLTIMVSEGDTRGFFENPEILQSLAHFKVSDLAHDVPGQPQRGWNLTPVLEFFRRLTSRAA